MTDDSEWRMINLEMLRFVQLTGIFDFKSLNIIVAKNPSLESLEIILKKSNCLSEVNHIFSNYSGNKKIKFNSLKFMKLTMILQFLKLVGEIQVGRTRTSWSSLQANFSHFVSCRVMKLLQDLIQAGPREPLSPIFSQGTMASSWTSSTRTQTFWEFEAY